MQAWDGWGMGSGWHEYGPWTVASDAIISGLNPSTETIGEPVTISGNNFGSSQGTVTFNGTPAVVSNWTDTSIQTTVPAGASSGPVVVTTALALITGLVFGLLPALATTRAGLLPAIKDESGATPGRERHRLRSAFVVAQVAVSLVLVITAGLFLRSLGKALNVDPGFDPSQTAVVQFDLQLQGYSLSRRQAFRDELLARVAGLPGVTNASYASIIPMGNRQYGTQAERQGGADGLRQGRLQDRQPDYEMTRFGTAAEIEMAIDRGVVELMVFDADGAFDEVLALCLRLKADPFHSVIPTVFLSRDHDVDRIAAAFECGADEFLSASQSVREQVLRLEMVLRRAARDERRKLQ